MHLLSTIPRLAVVLLVVASGSVVARQGERPYSLDAAAKRGVLAPLVTLPAVDAEALRSIDTIKTMNAFEAHDKRMAIATGNEVWIDPVNFGVWQSLDDGSRVWRVRVQAPRATDLHLGFDRYALPAGAAVWVIGDGDFYEGPYTAEDAGPLWVPMVPGDTATVELRLPAGTAFAADMLTLSHVGAGFRDLFARSTNSAGASGACNVNVVCPLGVLYVDEERALAYYEFRGDADGFTYICTGTLLSDVPGDRKNYVLTAAHCMSTTTEVASMRVYWNYQSTQCATTTGFSLAQNQTGATLRATRADADFTLVELNTTPSPAWNLFHAGWDASGVAPSSSIGLHHPRGDVAKVTQGTTAPSNYSNCIGTGAGSANTHWLTGPYNQGTTEGGSSGSGLWIPSADASGRGKRLIGVLSGGTALCSVVNPTQPGNGLDCYGKFSAAWNGASAATRLRDWLDPAASGTLSVAGIDAVPTTTTAPTGGLATRYVSERQAAAGRGNAASRDGAPLPFDTRTRRP